MYIQLIPAATITEEIYRDFDIDLRVVTNRAHACLAPIFISYIRRRTNGRRMIIAGGGVNRIGWTSNPINNKLFKEIDLQFHWTARRAGREFACAHHLTLILRPAPELRIPAWTMNASLTCCASGGAPPTAALGQLDILERNARDLKVSGPDDRIQIHERKEIAAIELAYHGRRRDPIHPDQPPQASDRIQADLDPR